MFNIGINLGLQLGCWGRGANLGINLQNAKIHLSWYWQRWSIQQFWRYVLNLDLSNDGMLEGFHDGVKLAYHIANTWHCKAVRRTHGTKSNEGSDLGNLKCLEELFGWLFSFAIHLQDVVAYAISGESFDVEFHCDIICDDEVLLLAVKGRK